MDAFARELPQPGTLITPETWKAYLDAQASYARDDAESARREAFFGRLFGALGMLTGVLGIAAAAYLFMTTNVYWGLIGYDSATGRTFVVKDIYRDKFTLPQAVDEWFVKQFVQMREGWDAHTAVSYTAAVSCMLATEADRNQLDRWANSDPAGPNQIGRKQNAPYWREVTSVSEPSIQGTAADGSQQVVVPFSYVDHVGSQVSPVQKWVARFDRYKVARRTPCNVTGQFMTRYQRQPE